MAVEKVTAGDKPYPGRFESFMALFFKGESMAEETRHCPCCYPIKKQSAVKAGTAGKGYGHIWQCTYCGHRFIPEEDRVYDPNRITDEYKARVEAYRKLKEEA